MYKIILPIDTKSFFYNIYNDNLKGHTATVASVIKQGKAVNPSLSKVYKIPKQIDFEMHENLINEMIKNSKSKVKINNVFIFDKIMVNGVILNVDSSFCFYTKEEIDTTKYQFGRVKLHYPMTLRNDELGISNRKVINAISEYLNNYAFLVESFEYDFTNDYLNFNVLIVGYKDIPYSKVFINGKGVGNKYNNFIKNYIDTYDSEIYALRELFDDNVTIDNYFEYMDKAHLQAKEIIRKYLNEKGASNIRDISKDYPYSLFDFQYYIDDKINYGIVFSSYTNKIYFNLSSYQSQFLYIFDNVTIFFISDLNNSCKISEIKKDHQLKVAHNVIRYFE